MSAIAFLGTFASVHDALPGSIGVAEVLPGPGAGWWCVIHAVAYGPYRTREEAEKSLRETLVSRRDYALCADRIEWAEIIAALVLIGMMALIGAAAFWAIHLLVTT